MNYLVHAAYVLYLASYAMRDMIWLRVLTIAASIPLFPYYYLQREPLWTPMVWLAVFAVVNGVQVVRLLLARRAVELTDEQRALYQRVFPLFTPRDFLNLLSVGNLETTKAGDVVIEEGTYVSRLVLVTAGQARVEVNRRPVAGVRGGQFVGEMGFLTKEPTSARVVTTGPTKLVSWDTARLRTFLQQRPDMEAKFASVLTQDVVRKTRQTTSSMHIPKLDR